MAQHVGFNPRHGIELARREVAVCDVDGELALQRAYEIGESERIQQARFEERFLRLGIDRIAGKLPENFNDADLVGHGW